MYLYLISFYWGTLFYYTDMPHFMDSSVGGHVSCSYFLAVMNDASMNICIQIFVCTYIFFSLRYIPKERHCSNMTICLKTFEEWPDRFLKWLHHFIVPPIEHEGSNSYPFSPTLIDPRHANACQMAFHCGFHLHLLDDRWHWSSFYVLICIFSLGKCLFGSFAPF